MHFENKHGVKFYEPSLLELRTDIANLKSGEFLDIKSVSTMKLHGKLKFNKSLLQFATTIGIGLVIFKGFYFLGYNSAKNASLYKVMSEKHNLVLLKRYGDNYIFKNLNKSKLGHDLVLIKHGPQFPLLLKDSILHLQ